MTNVLTRRAVLGSLAAPALLAACGDRGAKARAEQIIWHGFRGGEKTALEKLCAIYSRTVGQSDRPAKAVSVPGDALADKLSAAVPRGKGPDLFLFAHDRLGGWVEAGRTIAPLDFFIDEAVRADFLPGMLEAVTYKGAVWALPLNFKSIAMIRNTVLAPEAPRTTADLERMAKAMTDKARGRFGFAYAYDDFFFHAAVQNGFGGGVFAPDGALVLDSPQNAAAAALVRRWRGADGLLPDDPTSSLIEALFNEGRAGIIFNGPWFLGQIKPGIDFEVSVLPSLSEAGGAPMRPWMSVEAIYMAAGAVDQAEAWRLARFLTSPEAAAVFAQEGGQNPATRRVYDLPAVAANPVLQAFRAQAETAVATPNVPEMTLVWSPADKAMKRFVKGETSPQAAWADAQREVSAAMQALSRTGGA